MKRIFHIAILLFYCASAFGQIGGTLSGGSGSGGGIDSNHIWNDSVFVFVNGDSLFTGAATDDQIASEVPTTPSGNFISTDVQAGFEEHQADIDAIAVVIGTGSTNIINTDLSAQTGNRVQDLGGFTQTWNNTGGLGLGVVPVQQLQITKNFRLPATTATVGIIYRDGDRYIHNAGTSNFFAGALSGTLNTTGSGNTGVGVSTLSVIASASNNTAIGFEALKGNFSGNFNTAIGGQAMSLANAVNNNVAVGTQVLRSTTGSANTAVGYLALKTNTSGARNTSFGQNSMFDNLSGSDNVVVGTEAMKDNIAGNFNTVIGGKAVEFMTSGHNNTMLGYDAGSKDVALSPNTNSNNSVYLGFNTKTATIGSTNEIIIGYLTEGLGDSTAVLGKAVKKVRLGDNYTFNTDQVLGATEDGYALTWNDTGGEIEAGAIRWKTNRQTGNATGTTTITDNAQSIYLRLGMPTMTANTTINLPTASTTLGNAIVIVKFGDLGGFTATLQVDGGGNLENNSGADVTSFTNTVNDTTFMFQLSDDLTTWEQI